jgi:Uma2 family endonuclease
MNSGLEIPPKTIMEVYKSLPEGTLAELIDNSIYMSPSPVSKHQLVLNRINNLLFNKFEGSDKAILFIAPIDVYLDETSNAVQPDLIVVLKENEGIIDPNGHIHGVPDLLLEVLSPGNKEFDLIKKKDLYERFGVKEYWIVDPDTRLAICFRLENNQYLKYHEQVGTIKSELLSLSINF